MFSKIEDSASFKNPSILTPAEDMAFKRHVESIVYNMTKSSEKVSQRLIWRPTEDLSGFHGSFMGVTLDQPPPPPI
jgi:hypothetical protein